MSSGVAHVLFIDMQHHALGRTSKIWSMKRALRRAWEALVPPTLVVKKAYVKLCWFPWNLLWVRGEILKILNVVFLIEIFILILGEKNFFPAFEKVSININMKFNIEVSHTRNFLECKFWILVEIISNPFFILKRSIILFSVLSHRAHCLWNQAPSSAFTIHSAKKSMGGLGLACQSVGPRGFNCARIAQPRSWFCCSVQRWGERQQAPKRRDFFELKCKEKGLLHVFWEEKSKKNDTDLLMAGRQLLKANWVVMHSGCMQPVPGCTGERTDGRALLLQ